jgi:hypothetical protein
LCLQNLFSFLFFRTDFFVAVAVTLKALMSKLERRKKKKREIHFRGWYLSERTFYSVSNQLISKLWIFLIVFCGF